MTACFAAGGSPARPSTSKAYARHERILDVGRHPRDFYLVLTGPEGPGKDLRCGISSVFLLDSLELDASIARRGVQISVATSVPKAEWEAARVFPVTESLPLPLSEEQVAMLELLAPQM